MINVIEKVLKELSTRFSDRRLHVFDVKSEKLQGKHLTLSGKVLETAQLDEVRAVFSENLPDLEVDLSAIDILRQNPPRMMTVATNLTDLRAEPSWGAELLNQLLYGWKIEILVEQDRWVFIRQKDGYLGWAYVPYLETHPAPDPTHLVVMPISLIRTECAQSTMIVGRLMGGTPIQVVAWNGSCAEVDAMAWGWVPRGDLRAMDDLPQTTEARRVVMLADAARMLGVPYLWGGASALGIDCSGFAQLLHRWVGVAIPRDADLQYEAGRKVEPPFQPGDLLFFGEKGNPRTITHVTISVGGWKIIHSSRSRNGVYYDDVEKVEHLRESFVGACSYL